MEIFIEKLSTGYTFLGSSGICNWAQVPTWPCSEEELRASAFPEASEEFIQACIKLSSSLSSQESSNHELVE